MDTFLLKISFSISTSIVGIIFSVLLTVIFTLLSPEKLFIKTIDVYNRCLTRMWESSETNDLPSNFQELDEHRDPLEALAHMAVEKEVEALLKENSDDARKQYAAAPPNKKAS